MACRSSSGGVRSADAVMRQRRSAGWGNFATDFSDLGQEWRRLLAEVLGTFLLTFVAAGGDVIGAAIHQPLGMHRRWWRRG